MDTVEIVDRIYIGGLDPPRLTAQDVLSRLEGPPSTSVTGSTGSTGSKCPTTRNGAVTILSLECHPDKPYCHVTATVMTTEETPTSAFQVLYKTFNNVKWKGCRLTVQPAQPHFLDRLRHEIQERDALRQQQQQQQQHPLEEDNTVPPSPLENRVPRRRLRIRRKFGEEAYHVDTKPWIVEDWNMFRMAREKLKRRVEKQQQQQQQDMKVVRNATSPRGGDGATTSPSPAPPLHRAVHIRFDNKDRNKDDNDHQDESPSSFHDDRSSRRRGADTRDDDQSPSSSRSEQSIGHEHANVDTLDQTEYTWSDEEEDDDDNDSVDHDDGDQSVPKILLDNKDTHEEFVQMIMPQQQQKQQKVSAKAIKETKYKWSSDEESDNDMDDDDNDDEEQIERNRPLRQVSQSDEFAAGLADDDSMEPNSDDEDDVESITNDKNLLVEASDLANDVVANLGIFSSMFSDEGGDTKPIIMVEGTVHEENEPQKRKQQPITGFGQSGMMLRYDPNDATMHQFEIEEEDEAEKNEKSLPERAVDEISTHMESEANSESVPVQEEAGHLYEEKKLENVFRDARETWKGTTDTQETEVRNTSGAFSFGFDLEPTEPEPSNMTTLDSATARLVTEPAADPAYQPPEDAAAVSEAQDSHIKPTVHERRIKGFRFPDDLLAKYQADFFDADEGEDKETWAKERLALTLDWKRKRKHAQTRIQKRMKMR